MMQRTRILLAISGVFILGACSDPSGPCDLDGACAVEGVDLVVEPPRLLSWPDRLVDAESGLPALMGGDTVTLEFLVQNRGDTRSEPAAIRVCDGSLQSHCDEWDPSFDIPPLRPGVTFADTVRVAAPRLAPDGSQYIVMQLVGATDGFAENNTAGLRAFGADPRVGGRNEVPADLRIGDTIVLPFTISNLSRFTAIPPDSLYICITDQDVVGCWWDYSMLFRGLSPELPPGGVWSDTVSFVVPVSAMGGGDESPRPQLRINICIDFYGCTLQHPAVDLLPNMDVACNAREIVPGSTVQGQTQPELCHIEIGNDVNVWSFDAAAGESFTVQLLETARSGGSMEVVDHDGGWRIDHDASPFTFTVPATGRYHVAVADVGAYTLSFTRD